MKTYSENEGTLEQLEAQNILKRTGQVKTQGYVTLVAAETVLSRGQWAEVCSGCGRREQLGDEEPRMLRCGRCKEGYYCNKECQTRKLLVFCTYFVTDFNRAVLIPYCAEDWPNHKGNCKRL